MGEECRGEGRSGDDDDDDDDDDPPLRKFASSVSALRKDGGSRMTYGKVSIESMRCWKECYDDLQGTRTAGRAQLTAIMDGSTSRKKGADGQKVTTKVTAPLVPGCTMSTAGR